MQYFYDEAKSELVLQDIQTPSARRGVAIGIVQEAKGGRKPEAGRGPGIALFSQ
jgi:hypothetical protein